MAENSSKKQVEQIHIKILDWTHMREGVADRLWFVKFGPEGALDQRQKIHNAHFGLYWRLVALALAQRSQGEIKGATHRIASACNTRPKCLHSALTVLQQNQLIQLVINSENAIYKNNIKKEPDFLNFKDLFESIPLEIKEVMKIDHLSFEEASGGNTYLRPNYLKHLFNRYSGETIASTDFAVKYFKMLIHCDHGMVVLNRVFLKHGQTVIKTANYGANSPGSELKDFLSAPWWNLLYEVEPESGERKLAKCVGIDRDDFEMQKLGFSPDIIYQERHSFRIDSNNLAAQNLDNPAPLAGKLGEIFDNVNKIRKVSE